MNKPYITFHLSEANKALDRLLKDLESDPEYEYGNYRVDMEHLYHHINSAWNAREASEEAANDCSEEDFRRWRQFPTDLELLD
jgi:hypothetical protein